METDETHTVVHERKIRFWLTPKGLCASACLYVLMCLLAVAFLPEDSEGRFKVVAGVVGAVFVQLFFAYRTWRSPRRVELSDQGIAVLYGARQMEYLWSELSHADTKLEEDEPGGGYILLYNLGGRRVAEIPGTLEDFSSLASGVEREISSRRVLAQRKVWPRRRWTSSIAIAIFSGFFFAFCASVCCVAAGILIELAQLRLQGEVGEATVVARDESTNRNSQSVTWELILPTDTPLRYTSFVYDDSLWESCQVGRRVTVRYLGENIRTAEIVGGSLYFWAPWLFFAFSVTFACIAGKCLAYLTSSILHILRLELRHESGAWIPRLRREPLR